MVDSTSTYSLRWSNNVLSYETMAQFETAKIEESFQKAINKKVTAQKSEVT
jgi:hypothetical protein